MLSSDASASIEINPVHHCTPYDQQLPVSPYPCKGLQDEGLGLPARRLARTLNSVQSSFISASFFARIQPLICRSAAIASVIRSKRSDHTKRTGRRVYV